MKNMTNGENPDEFEPSDAVRRAALAKFHWALGILTGKWKGEILWQLAQGKERFGALRRLIPGVSQHMLTAQLRELEADGLVKRTVYPEVPPRVEYEITEAARALRPVFEELFKWSEQYGRNRPGAPPASGVSAQVR
jgi:DNA-binding HxlR family transcriptional regulator